MYRFVEYIYKHCITSNRDNPAFFQINHSFVGMNVLNGNRLFFRQSLRDIVCEYGYWSHKYTPVCCHFGDNNIYIDLNRSRGRFPSVRNLKFNFEQIVIDPNFRLWGFRDRDMSTKCGAIYFVGLQHRLGGVGCRSGGVGDRFVILLHFVNLLQNRDTGIQQYGYSRNENESVDKFNNCLSIVFSSFLFTIGAGPPRV